MRDKLEGLIDEMIERGILFEDALAEFEKVFILKVLANHKGNISKASEQLGVHRNTLSKRVEKYSKQFLSENQPLSSIVKKS
jgi:DNA-binding protein Fis